MNKRPSFVEEEAYVRALTSQSFQSGKDAAEAVALQKKVNRLEKKMKSIGGNVAEQQVAAAAVAMKTSDRGSSAQKQSFRSDGDRFCYRCGEDSHIANNKCWKLFLTVILRIKPRIVWSENKLCNHENCLVS